MPDRLRILIVDDDPQDREALRRALSRDALKYDTIAADLVEAATLAQARAALSREEFSCIFLDYLLPDGSGLELLIEVRDRDVHTPVIVLTGQRDEDAMMALMQAGAADYVPKSILSPELVARSVRSALRLQQVQQEKDSALAALRVRDNAISAASNGIVISDASLPDYPLVYVNPAFLSLTGYSEPEVLGQNCRFLQGSGTDPAAVSELREGVRQQRRTQTLLLNYRKDGAPFWNEITIAPVLDLHGVVTHFVGVQTDVTARQQTSIERRAVEAALQETVALLDTLLDSAPVGFAFFDRDLRCRRVNDTLARLNSVSAAKLIGQTVAEALPVLDSVAAQSLRSVLETGQAQIGLEVRGQTPAAPDQDLFWLSSYYPVDDASGYRLGVGVVVVDISERRRQQEELRALYEREHRIAESLQRSLLNKPPAGILTGWDVETIYRPAWEEALVGGDYFDVFALDGGRLALVVGDVSGKGLEAASRTAEIKYTLRAYLREHSDAASALSRLNAFLCEAQMMDADTDEYFVVMTLAVVDTATGMARIAVAGAEPPILLHTDGLFEEVNVSGMPLGIAPKANYLATDLLLGTGDLLLIATDGITEARQGHRFLGNDGMARLAAAALPAGSLAGIGQAILAGATEFAGNRLHDDVCLLLARRK